MSWYRVPGGLMAHASGAVDPRMFPLDNHADRVYPGRTGDDDTSTAKGTSAVTAPVPLAKCAHSGYCSDMKDVKKPKSVSHVVKLHVPNAAYARLKSVADEMGLPVAGLSRSVVLAALPGLEAALRVDVAGDEDEREMRQGAALAAMLKQFR